MNRRFPAPLVALLSALTLAGCDPRLTPVTGQRPEPTGPVLSEPSEPARVPNVDVAFTVRSDQDLIAISSRIYGFDGTGDFIETGRSLTYLPNMRWSAYNWENNASNAGSGYNFQNDGALSESNVPGAAILGALSATRDSGASLVVNVPILDHVAADKAGDGDVRDSGADYLTTRFRRNLPAHPGGTTSTPDTTDDVVYQDDMVSWVKEGFPATDICFALDSTPDLWTRFHPEVHPDPVGYDELVKRTLDFGAAVKKVWPDAPVLGFGSYGWAGWETLTDPETTELPPDAAGKGPFLDYWLDELNAAQEATGQRVVDYVNLHWIPEAKGGSVRIIGEETTDEVVEARLQAPRSLWDPTYTEDSWIVDAYTRGPLTFLPTMQERIESHYPGTKLAIGSWTYGGGEHISGAIATADALGIFGRYGVALAAHSQTSAAFSLAAFLAYRDYDGQGSAFGDTALTATTDDVETTSIHASLDWAAQSRVVVVLLNKRREAQVAGLSIAHPTDYLSAQTWVITDAAAELARGAVPERTGKNAFRWTLPALSVTVFVPSPEP